jgi:hypothetical protein
MRHCARRTKRRHVNWPALPKKITKIGRNKFILFWKAMHKSLCKQKEKKNRRHKLDLQDSAEIAEIWRQEAPLFSMSKTYLFLIKRGDTSSGESSIFLDKNRV